MAVLLALGAVGQSPDPETLKPGKLKAYSLSAVDAGDPFSALAYLERYNQLKPGKHQMMWLLAEQLRATRDYERAAVWYAAVEKTVPEKYPLAYYYRAQMLHSAGDYPAAAAAYTNFIKSKPGKTYSAQVKIAKRQNAHVSAPDTVEPEVPKIALIHLDSSVNKAHIELSPVPMDESTLLYGSLKADSVTYYADSVQRPVRQFFVAAISPEGWRTQGALPGPINQADAQTGNAALSADGNTLYFSRCTTKGKAMTCRIMRSQKVRNKWKEPELVSVNASGSTNTMPATTTDKDGNETLYFISDREGGKGGLDIWYATRKKRDREFGKARNLKRLNTEGNELTPWFDVQTNTLYFSSNGWPSTGGLDIFKATVADNSWSEAERLPEPLNSTADDLYYNRNPFDPGTGFLVSNRTGGVSLKNATCCDDIYQWREGTKKSIPLTGKLFALSEEHDTLPLSDYKQKQQAVERELDPLSSSTTIRIIDNEDVSLYLIDKILDEPELIKSVETTDDGSYVIDLLPGEKYQLETEPEGYDKRVIVLMTDPHNETDTMVQNIGVTPKRISFKGRKFITGQVYELQLVDTIDQALADIDDILSDDRYIKPLEKVTVSLHQIDTVRGKRVVVDQQVTGKDGRYKFRYEKEQDFVLMFRKDGYFNKSVDLPAPTLARSDTVKLKTGMTVLSLKPIVVRNIYYPFDKAYLTTEAKTRIDTTILRILQDNPTLIVELSSHTDSKGTDEYNIDLSQRRAESVVRYLNERGISSKRMIAKGYGETRHIAPNKHKDGTDYPEGRQRNRRTEFRVIGQIEGYSGIRYEE